MKKLLTLVVAAMSAIPCLVLAQGTAPRNAPAQAGSADQVMALEREWAKADATQDAAWFEKNLADSFISVDSFTGAETTKAMYVADVKAKNTKYESATTSDMKTQVFGDVVVVTGIYTTVKAIYKGQDHSGKFRWIDTWVQRGGAWQCVASVGVKMTVK